MKFNCKCPIEHNPERLMFKGCKNYVNTQEGICDSCYEDCPIEKRLIRGEPKWIIQGGEVI